MRALIDFFFSHLTPVQVGGAVKNVIAIAAGMCEGLGLGTNAMAALVTRGCNEMQRLALTLGARPSTLTGNEEIILCVEGNACMHHNHGSSSLPYFPPQD